ncbi:hypothetical protein M407DRAFT_211329 [Tulasnella calospora MUT 4182]|uniref:STB6-like N-terminal domain-containing protein n=1 Tax=Tulasnella calospora MUT 4182 TaxID=1051891 RepID=A0A0C3LUF6_9AGAM|nr:hypothetical protein M407DRAFT_211329 [Tulasnella calospora MUT 4182]
MSSTLPTPAASPTHVASSLPTSPRPSKIRPTPAPTVKLADPNTPRYILLPVSRLPNYTPAVSSKSISQALAALNDPSGGGGSGHRSPRSKHSVSKLTRGSRSPAVSLSAIDILASIPSASSAAMPNNATSTSLKSTTASPPGSIRNDVFGATDESKPPAWIQEVVGNFEIVEDAVAVAGFQLYAVEKWVVQREKLISTIAVYTGDEKDKIYVTVLRPAPYLSEEETLEEFHRAVQKLRKDGARPKETAKGIVMTTFLPNFRPDLTIVQIPGGNYREIQDSSSTASTSSLQSPHHHKIKITPYLSAELIQRITSVYAAKVRAPEPYKVHRVIKHKIDDSIALASNLSESLTSNIRNPLGLAGVSDDRDGNTERPMHVPGLGTLETPVTDLEILARMIIAGSGSTVKEGAGAVDSLRYVWTGKKNAGIREKERKERGKEMIEVQKERARDRERNEAAKRRDTIDGKQMKSDGEEGGSGFGVPGLLWKGKLFGSSFVELGLNRPRKNTDVQSDPEAAASPEVASSKNLPSLMVTEASRLDFNPPHQDPLSQPSSIAPSPLLAPTSAPPSSRLVDSFSRSQLLNSTERPATFAGGFDEQWQDRRFRRRRNLTGDYEDDLDAEDQWFLEDDISHVYGGGEESASFKTPEVDWWVRKPPKKRRPGDSERRHSISHLSEYQGYHVLAHERMEADVDLCSAYFDLQAKERDMERVAQLLQTLLDATRRTNDALKSKQLELALAYDQVDERAIQLSTTSRQTRTHIEELLMTGKRLNYRMSALDRSAGALETTLRAQRLRTKDAMEITGAEGANDDLKWEPEELRER